MLDGFHPLVAGWFSARFGEPSAPQRRGWPAILARRDTLISSPTGSGKTLAAFLAGLDALIRDALQGTLRDETQLLYISPLKALSNDVGKNLDEPLGELRARAAALGLALQPIRTAVRTGDTASGERAAMLKKPPHVLVTTPESLYVLLTSEGGRKLLRPVQTVIVDEIHAVAKDKRGAHLALSLERLEALCPARPLRIGLSATQRPIEEIARYLVGTRNLDERGTPRCAIVEEGRKRQLDSGARASSRGSGRGRHQGAARRRARLGRAAGRGAQDDAGVRQYPPAIGAGLPRALRAAGRGGGGGAPRQPLARDPAARRGAAQARRAQGGGGDRFARAGD